MPARGCFTRYSLHRVNDGGGRLPGEARFAGALARLCRVFCHLCGVSQLPPNPAFTTTHWSAVLCAGGEDSPAVRAALGHPRGFGGDGNPQGVKTEREVIADILSSIKERRLDRADCGQP